MSQSRPRCRRQRSAAHLAAPSAAWDPKEGGALITWLVYAAYLHMRIVRGWAGRRAAYFAIIGFVFVLFTFIGISYLLPGLHAYA